MYCHRQFSEVDRLWGLSGQPDKHFGFLCRPLFWAYFSLIVLHFYENHFEKEKVLHKLHLSQSLRSMVHNPG